MPSVAVEKQRVVRDMAEAVKGIPGPRHSAPTSGRPECGSGMNITLRSPATRKETLAIADRLTARGWKVGSKELGTGNEIWMFERDRWTLMVATRPMPAGSPGGLPKGYKAALAFLANDKRCGRPTAAGEDR